jgi:hypothetical protein
VPALTGGNDQWRDAQFCEYGNAHMIRTQQHKLICRYPCAGRQWNDAFYDLESDPRETINRLDDPALARIIRDMRRRLDAYFDQYTIPGRSGKDVMNQPVCSHDPPWARDDDAGWTAGPD